MAGIPSVPFGASLPHPGAVPDDLPVQILATIGADLALLFTLLLSAQIAAGWGELCGIRPGRDKSGLGGFAAILILFVMRWGAIAIGLLVVGGDGERLWLLGAHLALGIVSTVVFQRCVDGVSHDRMAKNTVGLLVGVALPTPALALVASRANAVWAGDSAVALAAFVAAIGALHFACYTSRRRDMLQPRAVQPATH